MRSTIKIPQRVFDKIWDELEPLQKVQLRLGKGLLVSVLGGPEAREAFLVVMGSMEEKQWSEDYRQAGKVK